jgi:Icc protein
MKLIQVTDTHLVADGAKIYDLDPAARLTACVAHINAHHDDAELCVVSGDLTDDGRPGSYRALKRVLDGLAVPYHLMAGNHDDRTTLLAAFPGTPRDADGFVQCALETPAGRVLLLDTLEPGSPGGTYCRRRGAWLAEQLAAADDGTVYLFMHHPPFPIGLPSMDRMRLSDPSHFLAAINGHANVRHIFFGHVHRPVSGSWRGIAFSALPSTLHQVALDFETVSPVPKSREPPAYGLILLEPEQTVVHVCAFLEAASIEGT